MRISDWSSDVCSSDLLVLFWQLRHVGIALATSLAAWLNVVLLALSLRRFGFCHLDARFRRRLPRILAASAAMGAALWMARRSEEHTSELQSLMRISYAVFCLKKKTQDEPKPVT